MCKTIGVNAVNKKYKYKNKYYNRPLKIEKISEGTILPLRENKGGVLNKNNDFVSLSYHDGEWFKLGRKYKEKPVLEIDEPVVYLGVFIHQWGHFILDSLSRAWIISKLDDIKKYKFAFLSENNRKIDGNYLEALKLLGLKPSQILVVDQATRFKEIIIPQMSTYPDHSFSQEYPQIFRQMVKNADIANISVPQKIYLTRTNLKVAEKKEFGEKIIEENFKRNGYNIVSPEKLTIQEQIAIFQKGKEIVCVNGSIPFDIVFGSPDLHLVIINKTSLLHINMFELSEVSGIEPVYLDGYYEPLKSFPKTLGEGPFILNFGKDLKSYFKKNGLKYKVPKKYPSKLVLVKYILLCLKISGKNSIKHLIGKK